MWPKPCRRCCVKNEPRKAKVEIRTRFSVGVEELDQDKLTPLGRLRNHNSIQEAVAGLGRSTCIRTWPASASLHR